MWGVYISLLSYLSALDRACFTSFGLDYYLFYNLCMCKYVVTPFPKSCHGNYTCIFLNCTDIYGDTSLFAVILMAYTLCVLLHNTCVAMKLYLCLPYYDYG